LIYKFLIWQVDVFLAKYFINEYALMSKFKYQPELIFFFLFSTGLFN